MKPYLLFAGFTLTPNGGINDLKGEFETIDLAIEHFEKLKSVERFMYKFHWFHVIDRNTLEIVAEKAPYS